MYSDITVPTFVVCTRKVHIICSYFLKYVLIKFVYNYGLSGARFRKASTASSNKNHSHSETSHGRIHCHISMLCRLQNACTFSLKKINWHDIDGKNVNWDKRLTEKALNGTKGQKDIITLNGKWRLKDLRSKVLSTIWGITSNGE
jgi:hypothetical protein